MLIGFEVFDCLGLGGGEVFDGLGGGEDFDGLGSSGSCLTISSCRTSTGGGLKRDRVSGCLTISALVRISSLISAGTSGLGCTGLGRAVGTYAFGLVTCTTAAAEELLVG